MTETHAPAVVTEYEWDRTTNLKDMATRRTHKPEPVVVRTKCRTTHVVGCSRIKGDVVASGTVDEMLDLEPWPCDCVVASLSGRMPTDLGETADAPRPAVLASPKQVAFLRSLGFEGDADTLSRSDATTAIDALLAAKAAQPARPAAPVTENDDRPHVPGLDVMDRPNRYAGKCEFCGGQVGENAGRLAKKNGRWTVVHNDGECVAKAARTEQPAAPAAPLADVPTGHYALPSTGDNDLVFYRVDRPTEGDYAGRVFVKMVVGGHPDRNVRRDAVAGILARIEAAGVEHSARLYGQEIGRCCRCNRSLTDEESRRLGIGPECRNKVGF